VKFINPAAGDFRIEPVGSEDVFRMGFQNFEMNRFGVESVHLKALAETPQMPVPIVGKDISSSDILTWHRVQIKNLETLGERSATGMDSERGVYVVAVGAYGTQLIDYLHSNDVILGFDGKPVNNLDDLYRAITDADLSKPQKMIIYRSLKENEVVVPKGIITENISPQYPLLNE
jgi:hypothetical protein